MPKVLVTEGHLSDIATAIRSKNSGAGFLQPGDMADAISEIDTGYPEPTGTLPITANGTVNVKDYASANVNVQPNLQSKTTTQNGTVTPDAGYDGLSSVVVNVQGGGGEDPFTLTDYIESSGTQYIDTGYAPTQTSRYEVVANVPSSNSAWATLFGARDAKDTQYGNAVWYGVKYEGSDAIVYNWGFANTRYSQSLYFGRKTVFKLQNNSVGFQASEYLPFGNGFNAGTTLTASSLYLFSLNVSRGDYGTPTRCAMKLYRFRIYEGDTLVHEFIPWTDGNDVICLKDTVTGDIKYNAGTGVFVRGSDT